MTTRPRTSTLCAALTGLTLALTAGGWAQDVMYDLESEVATPVPVTTVLPEYDGSNGASRFFPSGDAMRLFDGLSASLTYGGMYDSNLRRGSGGTGVAAGDDFMLHVAPMLSYSNPGTDWTVTAAAGLEYSEYLSNSDIGGLGGSAMVGLGYEGGKVALRGTFGFSREVGGNNRNYDSAAVERDQFNLDLSGSYRLSSKTTIDAGYSYRWDDPESGFGGTTSSVLRGSLMWRYSPLLRVGPGLRYSHQTGDIQADRDTFGPTLRADYQLTSKVAINSEIGVDFVSFGGPGGASDEFFHARLGANYRLSPLWSFNLSVFRDARADSAIADTYREILSTRVGVTRRIKRATLDLGLTYETDEQVATNGAAILNNDRDYLIFDSMLSMPVFGGRSSLGIFYRWRDENRGAGDSWDGYQVGLSLTTRF
jgi:hypothetical protein